MRFYNFTTDSPNFKRENGKLIWIFSPWAVEEEFTQVALSSCVIGLKSSKANYKPIIISCSMVEENHANYDGIVGTGLSKFKFFTFQSRVLEFWKIDCSRPRYVMFTLKDIDAKNVDSATFTLAFQ